MDAERSGDLRTPDGTWYRETPLPALSAFGRRFVEIREAYQAMSREESNRAAPDPGPASIGDLPEHLCSRLNELAGTDPDLLRQWAEKVNSSPFARILRGYADGTDDAHAPASPPSRDEVAPGDDEIPSDVGDPDGLPSRFGLPTHPSPAGTVRVCFPHSEAITPNQEALFAWLVAEQDSIASQVRGALAKTAIDLEENFATGLTETETRLLPTASNTGRHDDLIRPAWIELDPTGHLVSLYFDCTWEEVLQDNVAMFAVHFYRSKVIAYGDILSLTWDEGFAEEVPEEIVNRIAI